MNKKKADYFYDGGVKSKDALQDSFLFDYDDLGQLTDVDSSDDAQDEFFSYYHNGNRRALELFGDLWQYNDNDELLSYDGLNVTFEHDDNGNLSSKDDNGMVTNYLYDVANRLAEVRDGGGATVATYEYDPFGRRLWKEAGGLRTYFFYADEGLVAEYDDSGTLTRTYGYEPDSLWTTNPLFMKEGTEHYWYLNDHLGTPQKLIRIDAGQNVHVEWAATSDAFGNTTATLENVKNNLRFPGQYYDEESGLHYNWHRTYDPVTGRYMQNDPLGIYGGDLNLYAYVRNDPMNWIDPFGLHGYGLDLPDDSTPVISTGSCHYNENQHNTSFGTPEDLKNAATIVSDKIISKVTRFQFPTVPDPTDFPPGGGMDPRSPVDNPL